MNNKKPKIIGTGLSGMIGSRISELLSNEFKFVNLSLETGVNILDKKLLEKNFNLNRDAEIVLHLAAFTDTNTAWNERNNKSGNCYKLNVNATENIVDICKKRNIYLVHISTDYVFSGNKKGIYTEEDKPDPIEWYGETKYMAEMVIQENLEHFSIVRPSFPYGSNFKKKDDVVRKTIKNILSENLPPMFTDQIITPTFIDDIALGLKYFFENRPTGIYHLVGSSSHSPYELSLEIAKVFNLNKTIIKRGSLQDYIKSLPKNSRTWQRNLTLSNKKVSSLGIKMSNLHQGLIKMKPTIKL